MGFTLVTLRETDGSIAFRVLLPSSNRRALRQLFQIAAIQSVVGSGCAAPFKDFGDVVEVDETDMGYYTGVPILRSMRPLDVSDPMFEDAKLVMRYVGVGELPGTVCPLDDGPLPEEAKVAARRVLASSAAAVWNACVTKRARGRDGFGGSRKRKRG